MTGWVLGSANPATPKTACYDRVSSWIGRLATPKTAAMTAPARGGYARQTKQVDCIINSRKGSFKGKIATNCLFLEWPNLPIQELSLSPQAVLAIFL